MNALRLRLPLAGGLTPLGSNRRAQSWLVTLLTGLLLVAGHTECPAQGTIVWNGPLVTFTEPAGATGSLASDQDRLTADVWLTRNQTKGLFNAALESSYTYYLSPANTEWAYGALADYASLTYTDWEAWNGHNPPSMVGKSAVLHLISDNIYLSVNFVSWGGAAGGFSYQHSTAPVPEPGAPWLWSVGLGLLCAAGLRGRRVGA